MNLMILLLVLSLTSLIAGEKAGYNSVERGMEYSYKTSASFSYKCVTHTFPDGLISHCHNLTLFVTESSQGRWKFEIKLKKRISLIDGNERCNYYILREKANIPIKKGDGGPDEEKVPRSHDLVRSASFRSCKWKRRQTPVFEGTWFNNVFARFDIRQIDDVYVVGKTMYKALFPKIWTDGSDLAYDYTEENSRAKAISEDHVDVEGQSWKPVGSKQSDPIEPWDNEMPDIENWIKYTKNVSYPSKPAVIPGSNQTRHPVAEIAIAFDKLLMDQKTQVISKKDAVMMAIAAVNVAESFYQELGVSCKLIAVRFLPGLEFETHEGYSSIVEGPIGYKRLDAILNYLKSLWFSEILTQNVNSTEKKIIGVPDVSATFTNVYNDEEAGHSLSQKGDTARWGTVEVDPSTQLGFTFVKPINKMQINNLTGEAIHTAVVGASLAHQMTHLFGWGHPVWGDSPKIGHPGWRKDGCDCLRNEGWCVKGSCKKYAFTLPHWISKCTSELPVVTEKTHPHLYESNTKHTADLPWLEGEGDYYSIEEMLVAAVICALFDVFLVMAFSFHMAIVASEKRMRPTEKIITHSTRL